MIKEILYRSVYIACFFLCETEGIYRMLFPMRNWRYISYAFPMRNWRYISYAFPMRNWRYISHAFSYAKLKVYIACFFLSETEGIYRMLFPMRNSIDSPVTFRTLLKALTGVTTTSVSTALILWKHAFFSFSDTTILKTYLLF